MSNGSDNSQVVVQTRSGAVRGTREHNGVRVWRGIPYAEPPVGERRFLPPAPPRPWEGIRDATRFGAVCPQPPLGGAGTDEPMDEDCLFLNIWAPEHAESLPVLVWLHGGAYLVGSGSSPSCHGLHLAQRGPAVVVTLNYRLGYLGYLDLSFLPGAEGRFTTNNGLRDQMAALAWVRDNISGFGGDPEKVTIFGQSAGGGGVSCLLASPMAKGLFHAAIAQSPPANSLFDRPHAQRVTEAFLHLIDKPNARFQDILDADPDALLAASLTLVERIADVYPSQQACQPVIDGEVLIDRPAAALAEGIGSRVPLLIGSNEDEGSLFAHPPMPPLIPVVQPNAREFLQQNYPDTQDAIVQAYEGHGRFGADVALGGDGMVTVPVIQIAEALSRHAPVHVYRFRWTHGPLMEKRLGSPHTLDVPFVFGTFQKGGIVDLEGPDAEEIQALSAVIQQAWLSFARGFAPIVPGQDWPLYVHPTRKVLVIDHALSVELDPDARQRAAWGQIKPLQRHGGASTQA